MMMYRLLFSLLLLSPLWIMAGTPVCHAAQTASVQAAIGEAPSPVADSLAKSAQKARKIAIAAAFSLVPTVILEVIFIGTGFYAFTPLMWTMGAFGFITTLLSVLSVDQCSTARQKLRKMPKGSLPLVHKDLRIASILGWAGVLLATPAAILSVGLLLLLAFVWWANRQSR